MAAKLYMPVVDDADPAQDSIIRVLKMPAFKASDDENLACGRCKIVIGRNVSTRRAHQLFATSGRLIVRCECGADNVIPSQKSA